MATVCHNSPFYTVVADTLSCLARRMRRRCPAVSPHGSRWKMSARQMERSSSRSGRMHGGRCGTKTCSMRRVRVAGAHPPAAPDSPVALAHTAARTYVPLFLARTGGTTSLRAEQQLEIFTENEAAGLRSISVDAKKGDVVIFSGRLLHRTVRNRSGNAVAVRQSLPICTPRPVSTFPFLYQQQAKKDAP
jgi:hypothetical protein